MNEKVKVEIIHKTARQTSLVADGWPNFDGNFYAFKIKKGHFVNVPLDSIEIITMEVVDETPSD